MASIGFWDIETTGLKPQYHRFVSSAVARNLERDPWLVVDLIGQEREALITARDWLLSLDRVVSWGGNYFDVPFMNYRLMVHREPRLILPEHFDLKAWVKKTDPFGFMASKDRFFHGMEAHAQHVGIATKDTPFDEELWARAAKGDLDALRAVADHNVEDVITLRNLYDKMYEPVDERKRQVSLW